MTKKLDHKKIKSYKISRFTFFIPAFVFTGSMIFMFQSNYALSIYFFVIVANLVFLAPILLNYLTYEFLITNRKIYIKNKFFKINKSYDLTKDLCYFRYKQTWLGLIFNYGSFEFIDNNNQIFKLENLPNPNEIEKIIVYQTNKYFEEIESDVRIGEDNNGQKGPIVSSLTEGESLINEDKIEEEHNEK